MTAATGAVLVLNGETEVAAATLVERIVVVSERGEQADLYLVDPAADPPTWEQLTNDPALEQAPQLSPDGTRIVFSQDGDIWTMGVSDRAKSQATTASGLEVRPTWSPDSSKIAFSRQMGASRAKSNFDLVIHTLATGAETTISSPGDDVDPDWSPYGGARPILFGSLRTGTWQLFRTNPEGSELEQVTFSKNPSREPAWSPDGSQVAYSYWFGKVGVTLTVLDVAAGEASAVTVGHGNQDWGATWSPDGQAIGYRHRTATGRHRVEELYIVKRSGTDWATPTLVPGQQGNSYTPHWGRVLVERGSTTPPGCDLPLCL